MSDTPTTIPTWSFSALGIYETCPFWAYLRYIMRIKEPKRPATHPAERGVRVHNDAEAFVRGLGPLTKELTRFEPKFNELRESFVLGQAELEGDWGFTQDWVPTGWFADDVWARIKLDAFVHVNPTHGRVIDYKTGKSFGNEVKHMMQGQTYGIGSFIKYPELQTLDTEFWYLDEGKTSPPRTVTRERAMQSLPKLHARAVAMTTATVFPPKANKFNCRFCPYKPSELNKCPYGVE